MKRSFVTNGSVREDSNLFWTIVKVAAQQNPPLGHFTKSREDSLAALASQRKESRTPRMEGRFRTMTQSTGRLQFGTGK
ncbi:hypothetical protein CesoFtcFv8_001115 [Champsocephalus esox]|uniref:Uncharacterized protein n=1 Tax=Champsocephalus esox TaxID=159716 RepID=A0AAN8HHK4_9TELE|nr:hypothetical protein CesoFtcFv8_001115 [Champsocephalus esox]